MQVIENIFHRDVMLRERNDPRFTVVFDMDNTLFNDTGSRRRPGIRNTLDYLKKTKQMDKKARFDVVAVRLLPEAPEIEIIKKAFDLAY